MNRVAVHHSEDEGWVGTVAVHHSEDEGWVGKGESTNN